MTQIEVNKIITEKVLGKCWHEWHHIGMKAQPLNYLMGYTNVCSKCNKQATKRVNPDFSKWADYGPLLEKIQGEEWWEDIAYYTHRGTGYGEGDYERFNEDLLNPARGSLALAEFVIGHSKLFEEVK